jgi:uncharacterized protein (TIGR02246 family)
MSVSDRVSEGVFEERLRALEDKIAIYQLVCGYGYAVDGCNADVVGSLYTEDGIYSVADKSSRRGRERIAAITRDATHLALVHGGCAHMSTLPFVVVNGDRAVATCHTMVMMKGEDGFFAGRVSASRIELTKNSDGDWQIKHRQNHLQNGGPDGPELLARLTELPE